jgi:hypothetical protein
MTVIPFEIRVQGLVDPDSVEDLGEVEVSAASTSTVLTGETVDQAALMGLLTRIRAHGFVILEVRRRAEGAAIEDAESTEGTS